METISSRLASVNPRQAITLRVRATLWVIRVKGFESKPQVIFRGERLAVPKSIVLNLQVADIKVGKDSQLAAPGALPAECFSNLSVGVRMQLVTAEPGITITLAATNTDPANPHTFSSVLYGTVVE